MSAVVQDIPAQVRWWRVRVSPARHAVGLVLLGLAGVFFFAMFALGMRFFAVASGSMEPTLHASDRVVALPADSYHRCICTSNQIIEAPRVSRPNIQSAGRVIVNSRALRFTCRSTK